MIGVEKCKINRSLAPLEESAKRALADEVRRAA
jgi:hypothetical protein